MTTAPPPPISTPQRQSGKATASLVLGIIGLIVAPIISSTLAIILGALAMNETAAEPDLGGRGRAVAGLTLGIIGLIAGIIVGIVVFA